MLTREQGAGAAAPDDLPSELRGAVEGIDFRAFALLVAGRLDEIDEPIALDLAGATKKDWSRAEPVWEARLLDALGGEDAAGAARAYDEALGEALLRWERSLSPLDEDVRAYLAVERHLATLAEPDTWLMAVGLRPVDMLRLSRAWRRRFDRDPELLRLAASILEANDAAIPIAKVDRGPARLRHAQGGAGESAEKDTL